MMVNLEMECSCLIWTAGSDETTHIPLRVTMVIELTMIMHKSIYICHHNSMHRYDQSHLPQNNRWDRSAPSTGGNKRWEGNSRGGNWNNNQGYPTSDEPEDWSKPLPKNEKQER